MLDWYEPIAPFRRIRQSLGKIPERQAWKILNNLHEEYLAGKVDPFIQGFSVMKWYLKKENNLILSVQDARDLFLNEKKAFLAPATVKTYDHYLNFWIQNTNVGDKPISLIDRDDIRPVLLRSTTSSKSKDSFKRHLAAFFSFCCDRGWIDKNPVKGIDIGKVKVSVAHKMATNVDIDQIFKAFDTLKEQQSHSSQKRKHWEMHWFKPIVAIMRYAGLRREEAVSRKWSDFDGKTIYVEPQKGNRERYIPILPELSRHLQDLKKHSNSEWMFPSPKRPHIHITGDRVYRVFKEVAELAGVDSKRTLHGLRHAFVTDMLRRGLSTAEVKMLAGHSTVTVTEQYAHLAVEDLAKKMG